MCQKVEDLLALTEQVQAGDGCWEERKEVSQECPCGDVVEDCEDGAEGGCERG